MNKTLKIAGIIIGGLIVLIAAYIIFQNTMPASPIMRSLGGSYGMPSESFGEADVASTGSALNGPMSSLKMMASPVADESANTSTDLPEADKKIIKNGNLSLKVDNADKASASVTKIAKDNSGEVASSNFRQSGTNVKSGSITVKVPVANFEKTFSDLKKVASLVLTESTSGNDVTEQYVDLQAQLKNKQTEEDAFTRIMAQAQKIDDILAVQRELSRVRGQIEQFQGRIKYLDSQTNMSTITVNLTEDANISIADRWRPWQVVKETTSVLVKKIQGFVDFVIKLVILVLPVLVLYGLLVLVIYKIGKKIYFKFKKKDPNQL
jgi:hypothetical protein